MRIHPCRGGHAATHLRDALKKAYAVCTCFTNSVTMRNEMFSAFPLIVWGCSIWYREHLPVRTCISLLQAVAASDHLYLAAIV